MIENITRPCSSLIEQSPPKRPVVGLIPTRDSGNVTYLDVQCRILLGYSVKGTTDRLSESREFAAS